MRFAIVLVYALRNMRRARLRSLFTLLSITLIMLLYTLLSSVVLSFTSQFQKFFERQQVDIIVQSRYAVTPVSSFVEHSDIDTLRKLEGIDSITPVVLGRRRLEDKGSFFVIGIDDIDRLSHTIGLSLLSGTIPGSDSLIVGVKMAKALHVKNGDTLAFDKKRRFRVNGMFESWLNFLNSAAIMPHDAALELLNRKGGASFLLLSLKEPAKTSHFINIIHAQFPYLRATDSTKLPQSVGHMKSVLYLLKVVAFVTLVLTFAILFNTFLLAASERTREIAILGAIGWPKRMIVSVMGVESVLFALIGSLLAFLLSFAVLAWLQQHLSDIYYLPSKPDLQILWHLLGIGISMGILSALYPALYGIKISITGALRYE